MGTSLGLTGWAVVLAIACSGCSTLYSETRDKQGKAAKEAWAAVDLAGQISTARKNHAALLAKQLETESALARARRDQLARAIATGGTVDEKLARPVRTALASLAGDRTRADSWLTALADQEFAARLLEKFATEFKRFGVEMPPCDQINLAPQQAALNDWLAAHPAQRPAFAPAIAGAQAACADPRLSAADRFELPSGALRDARQAQAKAIAELGTLRARGLAQRNAFRAAKAAYDGAAKVLEVEPNASREQVQAAAKKLREAAETLAAPGHLRLAAGAGKRARGGNAPHVQLRHRHGARDGEGACPGRDHLAGRPRRSRVAGRLHRRARGRRAAGRRRLKRGQNPSCGVRHQTRLP